MADLKIKNFPTTKRNEIISKLENLVKEINKSEDSVGTLPHMKDITEERIQKCASEFCGYAEAIELITGTNFVFNRTSQRGSFELGFVENGDFKPISELE